MEEYPRSSSSHGCHKRAGFELFTKAEDETDSEIELFPYITRCPEDNGTGATLMPKSKRSKNSNPAYADNSDDAKFDPSHDKVSIAATAQPGLSLVTSVMKRTRRILDPNNVSHAKLIAGATKVGTEYYDSDTEDHAVVKDTSKPHLFRNVKWGSYATDYSNDADFVAEPELTQFIPGRFELQPDGTVSDQKSKLVIKLIDKSGRKRIFANPPPRDWYNQEAITALNKRTVQQIRRNTNVRFREVVRAYLPEERTWILANLTKGKPTQGWKVFVDRFNERFEGKTVTGAKGVRPYRSHSSLTKEVERFGHEFYMKGLVPVPSTKAKKE